MYAHSLDPKFSAFDLSEEGLLTAEDLFFPFFFLLLALL